MNSNEVMGADTECEGDPNHNMIYYTALTIKPTYNSNKIKVHSDPVYLDTIMQILLHNIPTYSLLFKSYEYDSKNIVHGHYLIGCKDNYINNHIFQLKGWHVYTKECYDKQGWIEYMSKDKFILPDYAFIND